MPKYPNVNCNTTKLVNNINVIKKTLANTQVKTIFGVTKCFSCDYSIASVMNDHVDYLADSRIQNLASIKDLSKPKVLLRSPQMCEIPEVVKYADVSLNSQLEIIKLLNQQAQVQKKIHKIILMIDLGDLREGIFYQNQNKIDQTIQEIMQLSNIKLLGFGANLTCYGAILPSKENLGVLEQLYAKYEHLGLEILSGGNSSSIEYLMNNESSINNLRIGETILLGNLTSNSTLLEGCYDDVFTLNASVIEVETKPSIPIGKAYLNAFGQEVEFEDYGTKQRAILAFGSQDCRLDSITPCDSDIILIGQSSDHTIVIYESDKQFNLGDVISFKLSYGGILSSYTSKYVSKTTSL